MESISARLERIFFRTRQTQQLVDNRTKELNHANRKLEIEMTARMQTEEKLQKANEELEHRVLDRTEELSVANEQLRRQIMERERIEDALRASEEKYRNFVERANDGIVIIQDEVVKYANKRTGEIWGGSVEELIGTPFSEHVAPKTLSEVADNHAKRIAGEKVKTVYETVLRRRDGGEVAAELNAGLIPFEGKPANLVIIRDVTERKRADEALRESEEKYRIVVENAREAIVVSQDGVLKFVNPRATELTGYSEEELTSRPLFEFVHPEDREMVAGWKQKHLNGETPDGASLFRAIRKDGVIRWAELNAIQIPWKNRPAILNFLHDVTDRKKAEEELKSVEEQLRQSQKMEAMGKLAGGIAHDFNNLLTVIRGYSQLTLGELKEEDGLRENIDLITKSAERASDLTRQLLAFSRHQVMEFKVVALNTILEDLDKMLRRIIGEDIEFMTMPGKDLGLVKVDPGQIEQVVFNLVVNARDAMRKGGTLTIETKNVELDEAYGHIHIGVDPGRYVMLSVSDTGCGMTPEIKERIFEPFFTTKEKMKGTGLGLSTVYGIVKQSRGGIWVYSEPGRGTTFKVYLPRVDESLTISEKRRETETSSRGGHETVLVVEDEDLVRKLTVRILLKKGYEVMEARNGDHAISVCEQHKGPISLLLTDVVMPGISGEELTNRLVSLHSEMKVLYMSGYTDDAIASNGILDPENYFLQKPFTTESLAQKVREVLDSAQPGS